MNFWSRIIFLQANAIFILFNWKLRLKQSTAWLQIRQLILGRKTGNRGFTDLLIVLGHMQKDVHNCLTQWRSWEFESHKKISTCQLVFIECLIYCLLTLPSDFFLFGGKVVITQVIGGGGGLWQVKVICLTHWPSVDPPLRVTSELIIV